MICATAAAAEEKNPHDEVLLKLIIMYSSASSRYAFSSEVANLSTSQHLVLHLPLQGPRGGGINQRTVVRRNINHNEFGTKKKVLLEAGQEVHVK